MEKNIQISMEEIEDMVIAEDDYDLDKDDEKNLLYKRRLRNLVTDISEYDDFKGIQITKEGYERIEQNSKYIISMLVFEIIEDLKNSGRKQIKPSNVDKALDKILNKVSGIDHTISMLKEDICKFEKLRDESIMSKVNAYINDI